MPTVPNQSYLRLTHSGVKADGTPNPSSVLINDMDVGYEFQQRKVPVYVPFGGYIDVPLTSKVLYSVMQGAISTFSRLGLIEVSAYSYSRDGDNLGGAGAGVALNAGVANNVERLGGVFRMVINAGLDTSGMLVGERLTVTGLLGNYLALNGTYVITAVTKGFNFTGANPLAMILSMDSAGANIAQELQGPGVLLTLPDGMITHLYVSSGNAGGLGANVRTYIAGDMVLTGTLDPISIEFSATDMALQPNNTLGVDATSQQLIFKNATGNDIFLSGYDVQQAVLSFIVDNTIPPPLELEGTRYLLSSTGGVPNIDWDGALAGDIVQYTSGLWVATSPTLGMSVTASDTGLGYLYTNANIWVEASSTIPHNSLTGLQGGGALERYHLTAAQHTDLTDGGETILHSHPIEFGITGHGNPNLGAVPGDIGAIYIDEDTNVGYFNSDGTASGWQQVYWQFVLGSFANDAAALVFIRANAWDSTADGTGTPINGMFYYNTTTNSFRAYLNGAWTGSWGLHAASHQHGGNDEIATVTPTANAIPKAKADGTLDWHWLPACGQYIKVAMSNGDFTSVKAAIDSITDASAAKPYVVQVCPGVYTEAPFTMKAYVSVIGAAPYYSVFLQATDNSTHFITGAALATLQNVVIDGPTDPGAAAIFHNQLSRNPFIINGVVIRSGYYGVWADPATSRGVVHMFNVGNWYIGSSFNTFIKVTRYGEVVAVNTSFMCGVPGMIGATTGFSAVGANAELTMALCSFGDALATDEVYGNDGARLRISGSQFNKGINAIHIGPNGATTLECLATTIRNATTWGLLVESATATVKFSGSADKNQLSIQAGASVAMSFQDSTPGEEGTVAYGEMWLGTPNSTIPLRDYGLTTNYTGDVSGGELTRVGGLGNELKVAVTSGEGYYNDGITTAKITWSGTTITLAASKSEWIYVDAAGTVSHSDVEPDPTLTIELGRSQTDATSIILLQTHNYHIDHVVERLNEWMSATLGPLIETGGITSVSGAPSLKLANNGGSFYITLDLIPFDAADPVTFTYWYRGIGGVGWQFITGQTDIDTTQYDDGTGVLAAATPGKYTKDVLYVTDNGSGTEYHVVYGQEEFASQVAAEAGNNPTPPTLLNSHACRLAGVVVLANAVAIASVVDARPFLGQSANNTPITTVDHAALLNLDFASSNHTGFQGTGEKGAALGYPSLDAGSKVVQDPANATAVPTASKIPIASGTGKLDGWVSDATAAVKGIVLLSDAATIAADAGAQTPGTSTVVSRRDHKHSVSVGVPVAVNAANDQGAASTLARSDHVHAHGVHTVDTDHALVVAATSHGFMDKADKSKLDGIAAGATNVTVSGVPVDVTKAAADQGASATAARSDHKHDISTAAPVSINTANSEGNSTALARANHVHAHGAQTDGTLHAAVIAAGASGFMTGADKTKLDGIPADATHTPLTATAPVDVTKAAADVGASGNAARADHKHDISTAAPSTIGTANAEGAATSLARSNHVHDHGAQTVDTQHALVVAATSHGFMDKDDKSKLDAISALKLFSQTASVTVNSTIAETVLNGAGSGTVTLPANYFTTGKTLRVSASGFYTRNNGTMTVRLRLGGVAGTLILTTAAITPGGSGAWYLPPIDITCRTTGAPGSVIANGMFFYFAATGGPAFAFTTNSAAVAVTTTGTLNVALTAQHSASNATNSITCTNLTIETV